MENKLKTCPFCGGEAHFITKSNKVSHTGVGFYYIIACSKCGCTPIQKEQEINFYLDNNGEVKITDGSEVFKQNMIDEWNRRTEVKDGEKN